MKVPPESSALSVFRLEKFVLITLLLADIASHDAIVVIVLIVFSYRGFVQGVQVLIVQYVSQVSDTALHMSGAVAQV